MIPRKQIKKTKHIGGLFIILLLDGTPKAVKREFIKDIVEKGFYKLPNVIKKCYRLKKSEISCLTNAYKTMMLPRCPTFGIPIYTLDKIVYSEHVIKNPYAYAKITT